MDNYYGNDKNEDLARSGNTMGERGVDKDTVQYNRDEGATNGERREQERVLVGIFETEDQAINVVKRLQKFGYDKDDITVIAKDKDKMDDLDDKTGVDTETPGDAHKIGAGAAIGGALGGLAAALPALGLLAIPGIGPILAAGPIAGVLGGVVAGGIAGGLVGALVEMGVNEEDAEEYERQIEQGKIVILVENRNDLRDEVYSTYRQNNNVIDGRTRQRPSVK